MQGYIREGGQEGHGGWGCKELFTRIVMYGQQEDKINRTRISGHITRTKLQEQEYLDILPRQDFQNKNTWTYIGDKITRTRITEHITRTRLQEEEFMDKQPGQDY